MFESLTQRLSGTFDRLRGRGRLTEDNIREATREVRVALLEADVALPVVQALTVNSPFSGGADTGHASWRSMQLDRWPSLGPAPRFAGEAGFDETVRLMVASGAMLDDSLVLWYARPSPAYPTIEVRVADV